MHHRIQHGRPLQAPPRTRVLTARPARLTAAGATLITILVVLLLVWAAAAEAAVWVIPAASRAYPSTKAGARQAINLDAAGNEYQGVQVCVRGADRKVRLSWAPDSHPLIVDNAELSRVFYVKVKTPTTKLGSRPGWYPDPLVPRDFGAVQSVPGSVNPGPTTPFYILVHVPLGTAPGEYTATLRVENDVARGGETVEIPFTLRVWSFGWRQISTRSAFAMSQANLERSLPRNFSFSGDNKAAVLRNFYAMMKQHGISPTIVHYLPKVSDASGNASTSDWAAKVAPLLDETEGSVGVQDNQLPLLRWFPWSRSQNPSWATITNYLTDMARLYKARGWDRKSYVYVLDETTKASEERQAEKYARAVHKANRATGAKIKFLLTDDPRPRSLGGVKTANTFLYDDVDIWTLRYYYFFGRVPAVRERKRAGKEIWWYTYTNDSVRKTPSFVIDKPHIDSRIWGWMMEEWNVDGLLNWGFNRWGKAKTGNGWRDPYKDPLSLIKGRLHANGCTSLLYPGYYPRYGLNDPKAPPVSSLRLEMLRDGLEEREYLKLAKAQGASGRAVADKVLGTITRFPYKIRQANVFNFPTYTSSNATFDAARKRLAEFIEAQQQ
jgi:hypothetical protein